MTKLEATKEAKKRWGRLAVAEEMLGPIFTKFEVGIGRDPMTGGAESVKGKGKTWEEAFADADKRKES
jgi:hypothetical protein